LMFHISALWPDLFCRKPKRTMRDGRPPSLNRISSSRFSETPPGVANVPETSNVMMSARAALPDTNSKTASATDTELFHETP
jgi:hypothetical protein